MLKFQFQFQASIIITLCKIYWPVNVFPFFFKLNICFICGLQFFSHLFLIKKKNSLIVCRVVCCNQIATLGFGSHTHLIAALGYISHTNQIGALQYVSGTNHIIAFGYCFLANDVMKLGGCAQRMTLTRNFGLIILISVIIVAFVRASSREVEIY